jgi:hypothetical protein
VPIPQIQSSRSISGRRACLSHLRFTVITIRVYCENDQEFLPCEISALTFSIAEGIVESQSFIVDPLIDDLDEHNYEQALQNGKQSRGTAWGTDCT